MKGVVVFRHGRRAMRGVICLAWVADGELRVDAGRLLRRSGEIEWVCVVRRFCMEGDRLRMDMEH